LNWLLSVEQSKLLEEIRRLPTQPDYYSPFLNSVIEFPRLNIDETGREE